MKLLILTQTLDKNDPVLGFFHRWVEEFAMHFEKITVICLGKGKIFLPANVSVYSLGKEERVSKLTYLWRFYKYIWTLRHEYDKVFVHMNQEYVLLGFIDWFLMGKPIYLWRNHAQGNFSTRVAVWLSKKVFCTSPHSFTARFKKTELMPVGVDTEFFKPDPNIARKPNSVLFLGDIRPVKKVLEFLQWLESTPYIATLAGPIRDKAYGELVQHRVLHSKKVKWVGPVTQTEALKLYQSHEIYVNKTPVGSFDKTIVEAAAAGCKLIVDNPDARNLNPEDHSLKKLSSRLAQALS